MMLKFFVTVLMLIAGSAGSDDCDEPVYRVCQTSQEPPDKFPESMEDLQNICEPVIQYHECEVKYGEKCGQHPEAQRQTRNFLTVFKDICNPDTLLHAAVADNIKCFSEFRKERYANECERQFSPPSVETLTHYAEALREAGLLAQTDDEDDIQKINRCLAQYLEIACVETELERQCGTVAMETHVEIVLKLGLGRLYLCQETNDLLPEVIRLYKSVGREEETNVISEIFKRRK